MSKKNCEHCGSDMKYFHWKGCPEIDVPTAQTRQEQAGPSVQVFYGQDILPDYIRGEE